MRVKVINRVATTQYVDGLPERGETPVGEIRYFRTSPFMLYGRDGSGHNAAENLRRAEDAGNIYFEIELDKNDLGCVGRKIMRVGFAAGDFTEAGLAQTFTAPVAFPAGARLVGGDIFVEELIANSEVAHASSTILAFVTGPTNLRAALACDSVTPDAAGHYGLTAAYAGMPLDDTFLNLTFTNTGAGAFQSLNTTGEFTVEVLYSV